MFKHLDKNYLHHAYLIEGAREEIVPEVLTFFENLNIKISGNPDFCRISIDNFKIDEALSLRGMSTDKSFSLGKKIFLICVNTLSLDAQNVLLKMFEEPTANTHFFLIVPDKNSLLKTLVSRFYVISARSCLVEDMQEVEVFLKMPLNARINFLKDFLTEEEAEEDTAQLDSMRAKSLRFINSLESYLHKKLVSKAGFDTQFFKHIFKVREFLRMPGSSTKTLMESVALVVPKF
ncbi:MAG: hypothetical protein AAB933_03170 [Patescibacteria group bacterium]